MKLDSFLSDLVAKFGPGYLHRPDGEPLAFVSPAGIPQGYVTVPAVPVPRTGHGAPVVVQPDPRPVPSAPGTEKQRNRLFGALLCADDLSIVTLAVKCKIAPLTVEAILKHYTEYFEPSPRHPGLWRLKRPKTSN